MAAQEPGPSATRTVVEASTMIAFVFLGTILSGALLTMWLPLPRLFPPPWNLIGIPITVAGASALVFCGAFLSRQGIGTPYPRRPPKRLVTTGPFARIRNPIIASWGVLVIGVAITLNWTGLLLLMIPAFGVIQAYVVYHEEPILKKRFPMEYDSYAARVPRWIPRLR